MLSVWGARSCLLWKWGRRMSAVWLERRTRGCQGSSVSSRASGAILTLPFIGLGCFSFSMYRELRATVDCSVPGGEVALAHGLSSAKGDIHHGPFHAPRIVVTRQDGGDYNTAIATSLNWWFEPYMPSVALEVQNGANQDGDGNEVEVRLNGPWDVTEHTSILELTYESIDREDFQTRRWALGIAYRSGAGMLGDLHKVLSPGPLTELRIGAWTGEVADAGQPREDEQGWYLEWTLRPRPRARKPMPWPILQVAHDSLHGTKAEVPLGRREGGGIQVLVGYSWMRWGEGSTASIFWRF